MNPQTGQLFSSGAGSSSAETAGSEPASYQPAKDIPGEGADYNVLAFDMAKAGFEPVHWNRPKADLAFVMRQTTIPEHCRAVRLASAAGKFETDDLARHLFASSIRKIGATIDPSEDHIQTWLEDLRTVGTQLVDRAYQHLCHPSVELNKAFDTSKVYDPAARNFTFTIPVEVLPAAHVNRVEVGMDPAGKPIHKLVLKEGAPAVTFSMRELAFNEMNAAADACDDPDDSYAIHVLRVMWAITAIGGKNLGHTAADLLERRRWLARIGHPAWMMISGTWRRMHEVDRGLVDRFLDAACAPA